MRDYKGLFYESKELEHLFHTPPSSTSTTHKVIVDYDEARHSLVGFYLVHTYDNALGRFYLKALTAAWHDKKGVEEIVAVNDLKNKSLATFRGFNQIDTEVEGYKGELELNMGYVKSDIEFFPGSRDSSFDRSYIGYHDLRSIVNNNYFVVFTGSKTISRSITESFLPRETFKLSEQAEYFTFKIEGFNSRRPTKEENEGIKTVEKIFGGELTPGIEGLNLTKSQLKGSELIYTDEKKMEFLFYKYLPIQESLQGNMKVKRPSAKRHRVPAISFSTPCPPRWDDQ